MWFISCSFGGRILFIWTSYMVRLAFISCSFELHIWFIMKISEVAINLTFGVTPHEYNWWPTIDEASRLSIATYFCKSHPLYNLLDCAASKALVRWSSYFVWLNAEAARKRAMHNTSLSAFPNTQLNYLVMTMSKAIRDNQ